MIALAATLLLLLGPRDLASAEADYRAGRYARALDEFAGAIRASADPDPRLLYDAGNCAYRLGRYADAALYYRRALRREPSDAQARFNLQLSERKLGVPPPATEPFLQTLRGLADAASPASLATATAALESLALACWILGRRRRGARALAAALLAGALATGAGFARHAWTAEALEGYVLASEAKIYAEPRDDLPVVLTLKAGEVVELEESTDRWVRLRVGARTGWTPAQNVGRID